ncbi:CDP-6-deoxy-delta-3,4-glucoseen reductase [Caballeronia sp. J97]|uniref:CDP-6-deoxy-delta-3,4-glucoseen reductase n=1 Tax=Caballeronia sp. J97 TaxID=2805429 RepID=UPI002AB2A3FE|nr:CDP-6-deoxy-delta-3,4-glucoseen reductase [Caballeronia sp. J97]
MMHKINLSLGGKTFDAKPGQSILAAGLEAGLALPYSCRSGICGTCKCRVLEGSVDHGGSSQAYLGENERREGYAMMCQAIAQSDLVIDAQELKGLAGVRSRVTPARVTKVEYPAPDVAVVSLRLPMNENLLYLAGQYIEVFLPDGRRRSYSIATAPKVEGGAEFDLHIRHHPNGVFTDWVFEKMRVRDLLKIEGPLGTFFLREDSNKPVIVLATGTGFAPLKAMLTKAFELGINRSRPIDFYWGGKTLEDLYLYELVREWEREFENFRFIPVLSAPKEVTEWRGRRGFVHRAVLQDYPDLSGYQVYACGSPLMVEAARDEFTSLCRLHKEEFFADEFLSARELASETNREQEKMV